MEIPDLPLPPDMEKEIIDKLEGRDLIAICSINRKMRAFCDDEFWISKIEQLYSVKLNSSKIAELQSNFNLEKMNLLYFYLWERSHLPPLQIPDEDYYNYSIPKDVDLIIRNPVSYPFVLKTYQIILKWAAHYNNFKIIKLLLQDKRIDPSFNENYMLLESSMRGYTDIVKFLLKYPKIDPNGGSVDNPIILASANEHIDIVKLMLKDPRVNPNDSRGEYDAIIVAARDGYLDIVKLLLSDKRVNPNAHRNYAIQLASENGHTEIVKLLLEDPRVDPSEYNNVAIRRASYNGHAEVVKLLLEDRRVNPADGDNAALRNASEQGKIEVVKVLLKDTRVDPLRALYEAIKAPQIGTNQIEIVKLLLKEIRMDMRRWWSSYIRDKIKHYIEVAIIYQNSEVEALLKHFLHLYFTKDEEGERSEDEE